MHLPEPLDRLQHIVALGTIPSSWRSTSSASCSGPQWDAAQPFNWSLKAASRASRSAEPGDSPGSNSRTRGRSAGATPGPSSMRSASDWRFSWAASSRAPRRALLLAGSGELLLDSTHVLIKGAQAGFAVGQRIAGVCQLLLGGSGEGEQPAPARRRSGAAARRGQRESPRSSALLGLQRFALAGGAAGALLPPAPARRRWRSADAR